MYVIKRDGSRQAVQFDKVMARIAKLCDGLNSDYVDPSVISQKVISGIYSGVSTAELDELASQTAAYCTVLHPDFSLLAARIAVSNLHKETLDSFSDNIVRLAAYINPETGKDAPLVAEDVAAIVAEHAERLDAEIDYSRDYTYDYFGFKTLQRGYLLKMHGRIAERPQQMLMRVALGIHKADVDAAIETYHLMSQKWFIHATPTLFNSGTPRPQMSSCFLLAMKDDSIEGIYDTLKDTACISKYAGGIGLSINIIRAASSYIAGTNGVSNGIVPMLRVFNMTARYVDQGGGKRKGSFAIYLSPWHADVFEFIELRKQTGKEEHRARDLFLALWVSDLFMKRVSADEEWSLFCPAEAPGLDDCYGDKFDKLYTSYEAEGRARRTVRARTLWFAILEAQMETGTPYLLFKDACNEKSNQKNLGTIKSSNLCTEIIEYTAPDECAVCNLASVSLPRFVIPADGDTPPRFDFDELKRIVGIMTRNLNRVIDVNFYPIAEAEYSNMRHRPIGIGVQGLADVFIMMRMPFDSEEARALNVEIFATMYYGAVDASCRLAEVEGPYETFAGSPASEGKLQFDLWGVEPHPRWDWAELKERVVRHGLRNSLLLAPMPTASTSQILGNNECFEPFTSNVYTRRVLAGDFTVVNKHLLRDLIERGLWTEDVRTQLMAARGSVQNIAAVPDDLKALYKTVWEIKQRVIIDMAADRGAYICQSQSLNLHVAEPSTRKLSSMHFHSWKRGLKTGQYYLRSRPRADAIQFTVDQTVLKRVLEKEAAAKKAEEEAAATASVSRVGIALPEGIELAIDTPLPEAAEVRSKLAADGAAEEESKGDSVDLSPAAVSKPSELGGGMSMSMGMSMGSSSMSMSMGSSSSMLDEAMSYAPGASSDTLWLTAGEEKVECLSCGS